MSTTAGDRRIAALYERFIDPMLTGVRDRALAFLPPQEGWRVLDVGCGTGASLESYLDAGCAVSGIDISEAMIERANLRTQGRADLHVTEGGPLPFIDGQFDLVTTSLVIHGIPVEDRLSFVEEMLRVTHPDGQVLITEFRFGTLRGWLGPASKALTTAIEAVSGHYGHFKTFKRDGGMPGLLKRAEADLESEKVISGGSFGLYLVRP